MINFLREIKPYIYIVLAVMIIRSFLVTPGLVNGESMEDTLLSNDVVLVNKIGLKTGIHRFDIVVLEYDGDTLIKRIIGLPGDKVEYKDNVLYINDLEIIHDFKFQKTDDFVLQAGDKEYIVLGDNRKDSKDSRIFGPVKENQIKGKVNLILFPFSRFGLVK